MGTTAIVEAVAIATGTVIAKFTTRLHNNTTHCKRSSRRTSKRTASESETSLSPSATAQSKSTVIPDATKPHNVERER